jgi:hypothetical protein
VGVNLSASFFPLNRPTHVVALKQAIDEALLGPEFTLRFEHVDFPNAAPRISGYDVFAQVGASWTLLTPLLVLFHVLSLLTHESEMMSCTPYNNVGMSLSHFPIPQRRAAFAS